MFKKLSFLFKQIAYDLNTGFLMRPTLITFFFAVLAVSLISLEKKLDFFLPVRFLGHWVFSGDVSSAQAVLGTIASSMITVVSIIYSILVMSLTLASTQFSPRILHEFIRDRASQNQLGIFIGTFAYCHITLLSIQKGEVEFVPDLSISFGVILALISLGYLIYFIHHISQFIQVNYLIDLIAKQTEEIVKDNFQAKNCYNSANDEDQSILKPPEKDIFLLHSIKSGYIQIINEKSLINLADNEGLSFYAVKTVGDFVIENTPLMAVHPASRLRAEIVEDLKEAFDIGPVRTMQQDVEFGIRQIVDVALKAISPAINDPTTASTCIEHLGRILILIARQKANPWTVYNQKENRVLLNIRRTTLKSALELSFNQIRQYGRSDGAVMTAMMRTLTEVARATDRKDYKELIINKAKTIFNLAETSLCEYDRKDFTIQFESFPD